MSARMAAKRARRHEEFAATFGCECDRHDGGSLLDAVNRTAAHMAGVRSTFAPLRELRDPGVTYRGRGA